jgi:histidine triad (HIT) family protein
MSGIFSRIVAGEIPCYRVAEDARHLAFLDISPVARGHVLVIPKKETDYLFDLEEEEYRALWSFARRVSSALKEAVPCRRIGVSVIGLEVPHAHIHLVPLQNMDDINFSKPRLSPTPIELKTIQDAIASRFTA